MQLRGALTQERFTAGIGSRREARVAIGAKALERRQMKRAAKVPGLGLGLGLALALGLGLGLGLGKRAAKVLGVQPRDRQPEARLD